MVEENTTRVPKKGVHSMYKKIVEGIVAHVIAGVLVSGVSTMAAEMPKSNSKSRRKVFGIAEKW